MSSGKSFVVGIVIFTLALTAALAFESIYDIGIRPRRAEPIVSLTHAAASGTESHNAGRQNPGVALPLRLVDMGAVGVPLAGAWGTDYSHDLREFREVILEAPPYVDGPALERVDREWRTYVERMLEYGNNAITVPLLLELIDFDRLNRGAAVRAGRSPVYHADTSYLARHAAVRRQLKPLVDWTHARGMQVFLGADMLALTPPLEDYLRSLAPAAKATAGIETSNPAVWEIYRAGIEELFDTIPSIQGLVIRIGEAGSLYNTTGWPYRSEMAIRDAASLRAMLQGLLPAFEARGKTLVLRSWTVGVGQLGRLHTDPRVYERVLGDINSPALIVSTKFTAGDFFSHLPLNPTLFRGNHRRLVELQARPEFEGFGAFPDFLGNEHARALRILTSTNPRIAGIYLWSQLGGPLRAGPRSLYPFHGFWLWTDANVYVASRLALDPGADVGQLARQWATATFGDDPRVIDAVANVLTRTREAVLQGFYIRPFAERDVRVPGLELPPLMWIFDWDVVGGWHSLLSIVYRGTRDAVDVAIDEGDAAVAAVRQARQELQAAFAAANPGTCGRVCDETLRSLEYQETLFDALAAWRRAFLSYYRWLETGNHDAWTQWTVGRARFEVAAANHLARFGGDLDFPAFDFSSAKQAATLAARGVWVRRSAVALLIVVISLLAMGSSQGGARRSASLGRVARVGRVTWIAAVAPWRLAREPLGLRSSVAVTTLSLVIAGFLVAALTGFTTAWISTGSLLSIGGVGFALGSTAIGLAGREERGRVPVAAVGPLVPGLIALLAVVAYTGPLGFWYWFWMSAIFRVMFLTMLMTTLCWTAYAMLAAGPAHGWRGRLGGSLATAGAGLLALTALLPNWVDMLRFLDRPLNFAPATETMLIALRTYANVSLDPGATPWIVGALLLLAGVGLCWHPLPSVSVRRLPVGAERQG
jgi:Glycosyl hydrolase family 67 C-terminus